VAGRHWARSWRAPPYLDAWLACLCSALLPPCPEPTSDVRVPLAGLHIGSNPCRVLRVCNWTTQRKFATTFPALQRSPRSCPSSGNCSTWPAASISPGRRIAWRAGSQMDHQKLAA
jgi:hypothetical protein